ncbi:MAG: hypothetical protein NTW16_09910 [Bacteroidetes bacterium]|nr:hypothetical protein [Bacteroidota bacterium]
MLIAQARFSYLFKILTIIAIIIASPEFNTFSQNVAGDNGKSSTIKFDEIPVQIIVEGYGSFYSYVLYSNHDSLYVNIEDLFKTLKIACITGKNGDSLGGFIELESRTYFVDFNNGKIKVGDNTVECRNGLVKESGSLYLESSLFAEAFGITLTFNYRNLTIILKSNFELPVIKQIRVEKMRNNMSKIKNEIIPDTVVKRDYHLFKFGMVDWSAASAQTWYQSTDYRFRLAVGAELFYGEADISVDYYNQQKFTNRQFQYLWRWVDNNKRFVKQAQVGNIAVQSIAFINSPVIGAVVRNASTTVRKATGYYPINAYTEPNWTVELYINDVLVDYTTADASGLYVFKVPIVYGNTILKLKFFGPMGEERIEQRTINVPYTVMPVNELEYGLSAGILQDSSSSRFGKAELNYGINRFLTVGGGMEYLSSISGTPFIPYVKFTLQPFSKLTLNGEYAYGVRTTGLMALYFWKDALLEIYYANYVHGQLATRFDANEERKARLSVPFRMKKLNGYVKIDYQQLVYKDFYYNQGYATISLYYNQFSANTSTQLTWIDMKTPYVTYDLALSYRFKNGYIIRSSAQYNISEGNFMTTKAEIEKRIMQGNISVSYERNTVFSTNTLTLNFKYDFSFAKTNVSASLSRGNINISESAQGSIAFGAGNYYTYLNNNSSVSKGGIALYPFLDLNNNGVFDHGERMMKLTAVRVMGGNAFFSKKDSIVRVPDLNAFISYYVSFDNADLENIAWRFRKRLYQILIDPNQFKRVDVPIIVVGEVSGMAYLSKGDLLKGVGRILVKFYQKNNNNAIAETLSESDGYIDYMGLAAGEYFARIDAEQLKNLNYTVDPPQREFTIRASEQGDIVEGIDFVLKTAGK